MPTCTSVNGSWQAWVATSTTTALSCYTTNTFSIATNDTVYSQWLTTGGIAAHNYNNGNGNIYTTNGNIYAKSPQREDPSLQYDAHVKAYDHVARRPDEKSHIYTRIKHLEKLKKQRIRWRSLRLLHTVLTREEWQSLRKFGYFVVQGGDSGNYYRIRWQNYDSMNSNIDLLKSGVERTTNDNWPMYSIGAQLCCHLPADYPIGDMLAAQKLMLKYEEKKFLKRANMHPVSYVANIRPLRRAA